MQADLPVQLIITRTDEVCPANGFWSGPCKANKVRIELSKGAQIECVRRGIPIPPTEVVCMNPKSGCVADNIHRFEGVLALLAAPRRAPA